MGLNENVTYNIMKERGLYRNKQGASKGKSSETLSHEAPGEKTKTKHTKRKRRFKQTKTPTLHLEARITLKDIQEATVQAASPTSFSCLSVPGPGTLLMGPHSSSSKSSPTLPSLSWSRVFQTQGP